jgi:hypothetical protein
VDANAVEIDDQLWSIVDAAKVRTILEGEPLLNHISVQHSYDYSEKKYSDSKTTIDFEDGRGSLGKVWGKTYAARGLQVRDDSGSGYFHTSSLLAEAVAGVALGSHFGLFGRIAPLIDIPCVYSAKQILLGDVVKITHPCIVDVSAGTIGTHESLGIVVGAVRSITSDEPDHLLVMMPQSRSWPISPCCYATAWAVAPDLELTIAASEFAQTGEDDMDYFGKGMEVRFQTRDSTVDLGVGSATITGIDPVGRTIDLDVDPFGGAFPAGGVFVFYADYDEGTAYQRDWLYNAGTDYTLGALSEDGDRWGA